MYDLVIIGAASAGLTAGIYAARKKINTLILTDKIGGQSLLTDNIENYPGFKTISGAELTGKIKEQAENLGVEIKEGIKIKKIEKSEENFAVQSEAEEIFKSRAVLIATGRKPRRLNVPGEKEFIGKGVSFCSICDAPLFQNKEVAVVGGGNAGLETAMDLLKYAAKICILEFNDNILGDQSTQEKLRQSGKVEFIVNAEIKEIKGDRFVGSLIYKNRLNGERKELKVEGIFVNIGQIPASDFVNPHTNRGIGAIASNADNAAIGVGVKDSITLNLNKRGEIIIDPRTNQTSVEGIFAAGDATDIPFKQCVIAAAEGAKSALNIYNYLQNRGAES